MIDSSILGMNVMRSLPLDVLPCVDARRCTVLGGVVRRAAGEEGAGQIVRHLVIPQQAELARLSASAPLLLQGMQATMAFSALNLAVSAVGFSTLFVMLDRLEKRLESVARDVRAIRELLERRERAELHAALERVAKVVQMADGDAQREVLVDAYRDLSVKTHQYRNALAHSEEITVADANEQIFCIALLGLARCQADMGSMNLAASELADGIEVWRDHTRRFANDLLLGDEPHRFLHADFVDSVSLTTLSAWLSFANEDSDHASDRLDDLRRELGPYYDERTIRKPQFEDVHKARAALSASRIRDRFTAPSPAEQRQRDLDVVVPFMNRLTARAGVLEGYALQYELMAEHNVRPMELDEQVRALPESAAIDGFIVLEALQVAS